MIHHRHLMHAGDSAIRRAGFDGLGFAFKMLPSVIGERNGGIAALLRAVMNQSVFADVQVAAARAAMPLIRQSAYQVFLELIVVIESEEGFLPGIQNFVVDGLLPLAERLQLARMIVDDADCALETKLAHALGDGQRVLWLAD